MFNDFQPTLFGNDNVQHKPLAERMRPKTLEEIVGQQHILSSKSTFRKWLENGGIGNILLYGPPGCGKTTLAKLIADHLGKHLLVLNAVLSNLNDLRIHIDRASNDQKSILFIDEIHRFNRSQQDVLLPFCESGKIQLIGATTHNPAFYIIQPLISRSYAFELNKLTQNDIFKILKNALTNKKDGLGDFDITVNDDILNEIARIGNGDSRKSLNLLEFLCLSVPVGSILKREQVQKELGNWKWNYNARENDHYDMISAFIKSMRGCDPDATVYWLARMLKGGEDPLFIARRLIIFSSEDIGLADPRAIHMATSAYIACEKIGMPECAINLSHVAIFFALTNKSDSTYNALNAAYEFIEKEKTPQEVSDKLKQTPLYREDKYLYSHFFEANISGQSYWREEEVLYNLKPIGAEKLLQPLYIYRKQLKNKLNESNNSSK